MFGFCVDIFPSGQVNSIRPLWRRFESSVKNSHLVTSWTWIETWLKHFGDIVPHSFVVGRVGGDVRAMALLTRQIVRKGPFRIRALNLGTAGEPEEDSVCVEYNRVLAKPSDVGPFAAALMSILEQDDSWDELRLPGFEAGHVDPFVDAAPGFALERQVTRFFDFKRVKPEEGVFASLGRSAQKKLDYTLKRIDAPEGELAATVNEAEHIFEELVALHQKRWTAEGKEGAFASERFLSFHRDIIHRLFGQGRVLLFRAKSAATTVACLYAFVDDEAVRFYQSGVAALDDNKLAPGYLAHLLFMEACFKKGHREYDLLAGDSYYKQLFSNGSREIVWARLERRRLKFRLINQLRQVKQWVKAGV